MVAESIIFREAAKTINLGMMYGMGVNKLSEQLDLSVEEAKGLTKQYHDRVPFVKGLDWRNEPGTRNRRAVRRTRCGRKCRFDLWEPDTFAMNKALPYREAVDEYGPRPVLNEPTPTRRSIV